MTSLVSLDKKTQTALLDSLAALARLFWGPDPESSRELLQGSFLNPFETLESRVEFEPPAILADLNGIINELADENALFQYLEEAYVRLFINSRAGITAPLYASCYVDGTASNENAPLMGPPADLMRKRFASKGLEMSETMHEPPDHLSIELEYLFFLLKNGWADNDPALLSEAVSFAGEAMLPWVDSLWERIADENQCRFYPLITSVALSILAYLSCQSSST
ncbi:MAG: molecular chaperone TorD family protein [Desulfobacteraceae bacterium]|jgi:TorA-specific chaperone|nr:molecular chaperone TorD family protein [Desulfobacteraceae bacterium]